MVSPVLRGRPLERSEDRHAGVVNQHVESPKPVTVSSTKRFTYFLRYISGKDQRLGSESRQRLPQFVFAPAV